MSGAPLMSASREAVTDSRHTTFFLVAFYALAVMWGVRTGYQRQISLIDLFLPLLLYFSMCEWAVMDARRRGHPIPMLSRSWFLQFALVLVPAYAVWSRGWRGIGWCVLHACLWFALATIGGLFSWWIIHR